MKLAQLTTPVGVAVFPWLNAPDTKFDSQRQKGGEYLVDLRLSEEDSAPLVERLEGLRTEGIAVKNAEQKELKKKPFKPYSNKPWAPVEDEEGNPTGVTLFKFKRGAQWTDREGEIRKNTIKFVDSQGQGITNLTDVIGRGSLISVCFRARGWASPLGISVALDIVAVQIKEMNAYVGADESFGFSPDPDGGYVSETDVEGEHEVQADISEAVGETVSPDGDF